MGEAAHAFVIRTESATVTADELRQHVIEQLNALWAPREVEFIEEFPLTDFGKVDKKALRARYLARLADAGVAP
jgi:fatty-acyl-CoA synthase